MPTHHSSSIWLNWQGRLSWLLFWDQHYWTKSNDASTVLRTSDTHIIKLAREEDDALKQLAQSLPNIFTLLNYHLLVNQLIHPVLVALQSVFSFKHILFPYKISHTSLNAIGMKDLQAYDRHAQQKNENLIPRLSKPES